MGARVDVECENAVGMKVMGIGEEILRRTKKDTNSIFGGGQEHVFRLIADLPVKRWGQSKKKEAGKREREIETEKKPKKMKKK